MKTLYRTLGFLRRLTGSRTSTPEPMTPGTVLIVDDEEPIRRLVERMLRDAGWKTILAKDGVDAVAVAEQTPHLDLLVTDLMMPNMTGEELARRLHMVDRDLPVLYLTGFSDRLFADRMLLGENEAFLDKPCTVNGLIEAVTLVSRLALEAKAS